MNSKKQARYVALVVLEQKFVSWVLIVCVLTVHRVISMLKLLLLKVAKYCKRIYVRQRFAWW